MTISRLHDFDPTATDDPTALYAEYAELRQRCPVARTSEYGGYWMLTRHADIKAAALDHGTFISGVKAVIPSDPRKLRRPPLNFDGDEHTPYRTALDRTMKPARVKRLVAILEERAKAEFQPMLDQGGGDICQNFALRYAAWVEVEWLNLQDSMAPKLADTASQWVAAWRDQDRERVGAFSDILYEIARDLIADRQANPRDPEQDPASSLLQETLPDGTHLDPVNLLGAVRQALVVGLVAPPILIGQIAVHLSEHQDLQQHLRANPSLIPAATEEFIRLYTPYRGFARTVSKPIDLHGVRINPAEPVAMTYAAANRDESVFENPDEFRLDRPNISHHLGFGIGKHRCAGMPLARLAIQVALRTILLSTESFRVNGPLSFSRMPEMGCIVAPLEVIPA